MRSILEKIIDALFPKEMSVLELEKMSPAQMVSDFKKADSKNEIHSLFSYKDKKAKTLVGEIKHHQNKILVEKITELMTEKILGIFEDNLQFGNHKIYLIPIPSSSSRLNERGYNPSELIAQKIYESRSDLFEYAPVLQKIRETKRQTNLQRRDRLTNLVGAFSANTENSFDLSILIDDVSTTGATIFEARRALQEKNIFTKGAVVVAK